MDYVHRCVELPYLLQAILRKDGDDEAERIMEDLC